MENLSKKIKVIKGSIFDMELQQALDMDALVLNILHGAGTTAEEWEACDGDTCLCMDGNVKVYDHQWRECGRSRLELIDDLLASGLDYMASTGATVIGVNIMRPFHNENEDSDIDDAETAFTRAVYHWLQTENGNKVDVVYLVGESIHKETLTAREAKFKASFAKAMGQIGCSIHDDDGKPMTLKDVLDMHLG